MRCFLRKKFLFEALQLFVYPIDLSPRRGALLLIEFHRLRAGEPPVSAL
jgi:hypothetical protein